MAVDYKERIPNNVRLHENRRLLRALEEWQPRFLQWWADMGPDGFQAREVYLRTATSVDAQGWAHFDYVRMPEYRWGIFLAEPEPGRTIGFGAHRGQPAWQEVPGEHRATLRRLIVTQGDTEPASVEQQRHLGRTCPSLYDLRNLFQVNVEEGRHLWAMVYLLHAHFGRDGREEAEALLHYKEDRYFLINCKINGTVGVQHYACGTKEVGGAEGTWRDAEDGVLGGNPVAQGSVDSTLGVSLMVPARQGGEFYYWMAAARDFREASTINQVVRDKSPEELLRRTGNYWKLWVSKDRRGNADLPSLVVERYQQSLLIIHSQIDHGGAVLAANDTDISTLARDTYSYMWPRD